MYTEEERTTTRTEDILSSVRALGFDFVTGLTEHPDGITGGERQHILEVRREARSWLKQQGNNPLATWKLFDAVYTNDLVINSWTGVTCWRDSDPDSAIGNVSIGDTLNRLEDVLGMPLMMPKDFFERRLAAFLRWRKFSPVKRYLENLPELTPSDWEDWGRLAEKLFGATDHLSQVKLSRWLIAAVARVYKPGCKADSALVIQGSQGIGKTSFLAALFGEYFQTLHSHMGTLEQQRILQRAWGCELGELEATFRAKDISALKAFLTETSDTYRDLYQNSPEKHPRHCVFAGTTNETAFLNDPTGSRRFWIVSVGDHPIPVGWVSANRDLIWAVAKYLYLEGEQWWLTEDEAALSEQTNKAFQTESSFEEPLRVALDILEELGEIAIAASDAMTYLLGIKPENHRKYSRELASVMASLGYERKNFASKKLKGWHYVRPGASEPTRFEPYMADRIAERRNSPQSDRRR